MGVEVGARRRGGRVVGGETLTFQLKEAKCCMSGDGVRGPGGDPMGVEEAVLGFAEYLSRVKGTSASTAEVYGRHVRSFLGFA